MTTRPSEQIIAMHGLEDGSHEQLLERLRQAIEQVNAIVLGSPDAVKLTFCCLLAGGHLLVEDVPGVGKTTLANAMARTLDLRYRRIQFTSDLLPADVVGISVYSQNREQFSFQPGPVFSQLLLADEINRAPPRTQSALLEAMAENQVTVDGELYPLPQPFFVIATQNPIDLAGTWTLPDSQLDRFLLKISLGYPPASSERQLLEQPQRQDLMQNAESLLREQDVLQLIRMTSLVHCSPDLLDYLQALIERSRAHDAITVGLSPRAGLALQAAARARALLEGRMHAEPDDVKAVFTALTGHRLKLRQHQGEERPDADAMAAELLATTPIP